MGDFRIGSEHDGSIIIVRPLPNAKDVKNPLMSYKVAFDMSKYKWIYRYKCFALVDNKLEIFDFSETTRKHILPTQFFLNNNTTILIGVEFVDDKIINTYKVVQNDNYEFSSTKEKRDYIQDLLMNTPLDLSESIKKQKEELSSRIIILPTLDGVKSITLGEIYKEEE